MRCSARLCAAADFGVLFSSAAISLLSASYDMIFLRTRPVSHRGTGPSQVSSLPSVYCKKLFPDVRKRPDQVGAPLMYQLFPLEVQLQRELHKAWIACALHAAKV